MRRMTRVVDVRRCAKAWWSDGRPRRGAGEPFCRPALAPTASKRPRTELNDHGQFPHTARAGGQIDSLLVNIYAYPHSDHR